MKNHYLMLLWCLLSAAGCYESHTVGTARRAPEDSGEVQCGTDRCAAATASCLVCEGVPVCMDRPDFEEDGLPDWWTNGQLCDPPLPMYESAPEYDCDDDGDCLAGQLCVAEGDSTFCVSEMFSEWWDTCLGDQRGHLCDTAADCPPCASECVPLLGLGQGRCASP